MVLPAKKLLKILAELNRCFPRLQRVSSYALPRNLKKKTDAELCAIHEAGVRI